MGAVITKKVLSEGTTKLVLSIFLDSQDGTDGDLTNLVVLDPTVDLNPTQGSYNQLSIAQIWFSAVWFDVVLSFNALNPQKSWVLARDAAHYHDFRYFGGLKDQAGTDHDGKLLISTNGFDVPGSVGSLIIELKKNANAPSPIEYQSGLLP